MLNVGYRSTVHEHRYNPAHCSSQHLYIYCRDVDWVIAENSLILRAEALQSCPLGKGMFVKGNLYKWEICTNLRELSFLSLTFFSYQYSLSRTHTTAHFQYSHSFYSPNSDCEMTQYFNQLYLICTPAEDRATCVLLLPLLAMSMPTGWLWAALDCHAWQSLWPTRRVRLQSIPP